MDESFEISAVDGSFHEEQEVGSQYECNECTYKTCFKQNLKRHKHAKHPIPVATTPTQAVVLMCHHCGTEFKSKYGLRCNVRSKHEGTFKYTCDSCRRGFQGLWNFRGHLRSHNVALKESLLVTIGENKYSIIFVQFQCIFLLKQNFYLQLFVQFFFGALQLMIAYSCS